MEKNQVKISRRYGALDSLRGVTLISMIIYHICWDLVYLFGKNWNWYKGSGAYLWQQSICWSFILLSGFCWSLGRKPLKRGLVVFGAGAIVSIVTLLFMPEDRVIFGVLTLIGSSMICMVLLDGLFQRIPPWTGLLGAGVLFVITRNVNNGFLGFENWNFLKLPEGIYQGYFMTFLGFPKPGFYSTDYFSMIPWFFLFLSGYFIYRMIKDHKDSVKNKFFTHKFVLAPKFAGCWQEWGIFMERHFIRGWEPFAFLGRHSLIIYMLHQPVAFGVLILLDRMSLLF